MTAAIKNLISKYKDIIFYGIFGVLTTLVNIILYWILAHHFKLMVMQSTMLAWAASVLFAYFTNRKWVFHSKAIELPEILKELVSFFVCRIATGIVDWGIMYIFVDLLECNDVVVKVLSNILVIVINFIASKIVIFKKTA